MNTYITEENLSVVDVEVLEARYDDKPVVRRLLELYSYDFSRYDDADVDAHGLYGYRYLDNYWTEPARCPFLFRVEERWAGCALVRAGSAGVPHDMTEFFVLAKYRRRGVGIAAARALFALFPGPWQVRQLTANTDATNFWRRAIPVPFEEELTETGPVQRFVSDSLS
jgi:predicted acetyltransferase